MHKNNRGEPGYLKLFRSGELGKRAEAAYQMLESCNICPRKCGINRLKNETGFCKTGLKPKVFSHMPHRGEEPPISGNKGSGTIFFSNCNMACAYCQNFEFSQKGDGKEIELENLASIMLELQGSGCHNLNLVTPTHIMPQILKSLEMAAANGLRIPIVYNTSGYEMPEMIRLLDGIVDIYLADMRYADNDMAAKFSMAPDYPEYNQASIKEMFRQVKGASFGQDDIMTKGLIIRHLVLPNSISGTEKIMRFISQHLSKGTYISLMSQYTPYHKAAGMPEIDRRVSLEEYEAAIKIMDNCGLHNGWTQESGGLERFAGVNIKKNV